MSDRSPPARSKSTVSAWVTRELTAADDEMLRYAKGFVERTAERAGPLGPNAFVVVFDPRTPVGALILDGAIGTNRPPEDRSLVALWLPEAVVAAMTGAELFERYMKKLAPGLISTLLIHDKERVLVAVDYSRVRGEEAAEPNDGKRRLIH